MLATDKQIAYLVRLANKVESIQRKFPRYLKGKECTYIDWTTERHKGVTVEDASLRIDAYRQIINGINLTRKLENLPQFR